MPLKSGIMPRNYAAIMPKLCRNYAEIMLYYAGIMLLCRNYAFYATRCFYAAIMLLCHVPTDLRIWPPEFFLPVFGRIGASCLWVPRAMFVREFFGSTHYATFRGSRETVKRSIVNRITELLHRSIYVLLLCTHIAGNRT